MEFDILLRSGKKLHFTGTQVMGIVNVTPDSFFARSRTMKEDDLRARVISMVQAGATMIDVGACSTRPGSKAVSEEEEKRRLEWALPVVIDAIHEARCTHQCEGCTVDDNPIPVSVDTFRASIAEYAITRLGADIINDVYGGERDPEMIATVNRLGAPYVLTAPVADVEDFFDKVLPQIHGAQVILDPGFGFGKNLQQNYSALLNVPFIIKRYPESPVLVGISRKRMVWKLLAVSPLEALGGTTILNALAAVSGAHILRVHDVKECIDAVKLVNAEGSIFDGNTEGIFGGNTESIFDESVQSMLYSKPGSMLDRNKDND